MTTTAMLDKTADHPEIWLEPKSDDYDSEGRMWCQDNQWGTEGVRYVRADTHAAGDVTGLVERLERRAKTMNGAQPVGAGDGNTYTVGYYSLGDNKLDTEAAAAHLALSARTEAAEARVKEMEAERGAHKEGRLEAIVEAYPDIAAVIEKIGRVEWGATVEQSDEAHIEDFANTLRLTREHFGTPEQTAKHGVYVEGTGVVVGHTGTSPNSGQHARIIVGMWNELADALAARSLSPIKEANRG